LEFRRVLFRSFDGSHFVSVIVRNSCGGQNGSVASATSCAICLSRGTASLLTDTTGSSSGRTNDTRNCGIIRTNAWWFKMVASDTGPVTVSTEGRSYDTILGIFRGPIN